MLTFIRFSITNITPWLKLTVKKFWLAFMRLTWALVLSGWFIESLTPWTNAGICSAITCQYYNTMLSLFILHNVVEYYTIATKCIKIIMEDIMLFKSHIMFIQITHNYIQILLIQESRNIWIQQHLVLVTLMPIICTVGVFQTHKCRSPSKLVPNK